MWFIIWIMCTQGICRLSIGRYSQPIWWPIVGQYTNRYLVDMSAENHPTYWPTSTNMHVGQPLANSSPPLDSHLADTLLTLGQHAHLLSSCYWVLSFLLNWEGLLVIVILFRPLTPATFMSFFQLHNVCFFCCHHFDTFGVFTFASLW